MKNRYIALMLGAAIMVSVCSACGNTTASQSVTGETSTAESQVQQDAVYGQVTSVGEDSLTVVVGTMKEMDDMGQPGENGSDTAENPAAALSTEETDTDKTAEQPQDMEEQPSMLELTGAEMTVTVTEDTEITRGGMGFQMQNNGQQPGGDAAGQSDGEVPAKPEGDDAGQSDGEKAEQPGSEVPAKPEGDDAGQSDGEKAEQPSGEVPAKPEGDQTEQSEGGADGQPGGEMPGGQDMSTGETIALSDIAEGDTVAIVADENNQAISITVMSMGGGMMGGGMDASADITYSAVSTYSEDAAVEGETIASTGKDENAVLVSDGAAVSLLNTSISRTSDDSTGGDASSFYGVGAAVLAKEGTAYVKNSTITTDAAGGAGLFAYDQGVVYAADSLITTTKDTSGGIHAAGGGTLYAWDLDVTTEGGSAAAIRSDRGGGTMVVDGGTYTSNGTGSPAVYCTADISVNNAKLTATGSEAVCIEGLNSLRLFDCDLSGNMSDDSQNDCTWTVIVYQSMSGDSEVGNGDFEMTGGTLTSGNGGVFYTTNTECTFTLNNVTILPSNTNAFFLRCTGNNNQRGWGTAGSNGSDCNFTAIEQSMTGDVIWDSISQLDFYMTENSKLTGAFVQDETYAGNGGTGYANVYIDASSTWAVSGDSRLTALYNQGTIVDTEGNTVTVVGTDGTTYVQGTGKYTVTVESYSDSVDVSGATSIGEWSDYAAERPADL